MSQESRSTAAAVLDRVRAAERRGDFVGAFDLARRGLEVHPGDLKLAHRAVLALARSGATAGASAMLGSLGALADDELIALDARLAKDEAPAATGEQRQRKAREQPRAMQRCTRRTARRIPRSTRRHCT